MCQFDVSRYLYPCNTFVYRLVHRCRQTVPHCMKVDLRQRHIRKGEPCRHPEVCNWCCSMKGLGKDAVMKHWNEVKSLPLTLHMGSLALPVPESARESAPEAKFVEYDGTTYYIPPSEFQHRILPTLLREACAKRRAKKDTKMAKKDGAGTPVIVVTPGWKGTPEKPIATVNGLDPVVFTAEYAVKTKVPFISNTTITNRKYINTATSQENKLRAGYFAQPQYSLSQNQLSGHLYCEWKFNEGIDQQGRFVVAVNHHWNTQQFPERVLYQSWYIQSENPIYGGYRYPMYQQDYFF